MPYQHQALDTLIASVVAQDARKHDVLVDTRRMTFVAEEEGIVVDADLPDGVESFRMNDHAIGQLATDLEIPKRYFDRMRERSLPLLEENVKHWLYSEPEKRMIRGLRPNGDGGPTVGRAWLSNAYRRLDNIEIARTLLPEFDGLGTDVEFLGASVTEDRLYLRATFPAMEAEVKVGTPIRWGVEIRNSEVGAGKMEINGFVLTLACTNGMTVDRVLGARHIGRRLNEEGIYAEETLVADDAAFWLAARDALRATVTETRFAEIVDRLRATTEGEEVRKPIAASEVLAQRYSLSDDEREDVLLSLYSVADMSQWGRLSAVTQGAQRRESFDRQAELEEIGWSIATLPTREWETIALAS